MRLPSLPFAELVLVGVLCVGGCLVSTTSHFWDVFLMAIDPVHSDRSWSELERSVRIMRDAESISKRFEEGKVQVDFNPVTRRYDPVGTQSLLELVNSSGQSSL